MVKYSDNGNYDCNLKQKVCNLFNQRHMLLSMCVSIYLCVHINRPSSRKLLKGGGQNKVL